MIYNAPNDNQGHSLLHIEFSLLLINIHLAPKFSSCFPECCVLMNFCSSAFQFTILSSTLPNLLTHLTIMFLYSVTKFFISMVPLEKKKTLKQ
jgi:hypothetical protein